MVFVAQPGEHPSAPGIAISTALQAPGRLSPATLETRPNPREPPPNSSSFDRPQVRAEAKPHAVAPSDDTAILDKLHDLAGEDPPLSMSLAWEALARNPDGPNAPELEWNVVKALYNMGLIEEAKEEARKMVDAYPESSFTGDVVRHLLHPLPNTQ
jgi:hypothetical protein